MRGLMLLFFAPAVYGLGNMTVTAGALSCGAVMRASDQVQTYCYAPGLRLVHNTLNTVATEMIVDYTWCVHRTGCALSHVTWAFKLNQTTGGIDWRATVDALTITNGSFTGVYGTAAATCPPLTVPSSRVVLNWQGDRVPATFWYRGPEVCVSWFEKDTANLGWVNGTHCGLVNLFQFCPASP